MATFAAGLTLPCGVTIKNRFLKSAMSEQFGDGKHDPLPGLVELYGTWAAGGAGLLVTGHVMVDRESLAEPRNVVLDEKSDLAAFERWAEAGSRNDTRIFMQLNHPGKQALLSREPVAPSSVPLILRGGAKRAFSPPRALTEREIVALVARFATTARLAKRAGFAGVQIHAAHGYLVSQFLSPHHNRREDAWGGTAERRRKFLLEVYAAMRAEVGPSYPLSIKLNCSDFQEGGLTEEESLTAAEALASAGIDLIEVSGGSYEAPAMMGARASSGEPYFLEYTKKLRARVKVPLVVTGGFRSGPVMAAALDSGVTDMIGLARPFVIYPDLPNRLLADPTTSITLPHPSTHVRAIDRALMLDLTWYQAQLARMARGEAPKETLSAWRAIALLLRRVAMPAST